MSVAAKFAVASSGGRAFQRTANRRHFFQCRDGQHGNENGLGARHFERALIDQPIQAFARRRDADL